MPPRLIVLGWDSATFDVIDPLIERGKLPALRAIADRGVRAPLRSTWPPMTDCAWTSAFTGVNPGTHGIFGSWYRAPGAYECRYFSSRDRRAPAAWELTDAARWLVWNVPMTYPAAPVEGVMVAGYGAPPGARFCEPRSFQDELGQRWPLEDLLDRAPHSTLERFLDDLLRGLRAQAEALPWAAQHAGADVVAAVWPHVDRAQHFFWRFRGTDHPLADAVDIVYEEMDRTTGKIVEAFPDADVFVVSDHGAGPLYADVNVGAWLVDRGLATRSTATSSALTKVAWALPPRVRTFARRIAPGAARRTMKATLAGQLGPYDWSQTKAFVGLNGDLWLNLEGREATPTVSLADAPGLVEEIAEGLLSEQLTGDGPLFAAAYRREEIYSGPAIDLAPDLMLDSWSRGFRVAPKKDTDEIVVAPTPLHGVGEAWSSEHRPVGIFAAAGPRIASDAGADDLSLYDLTPTLLALLAQPIPAGLDGRAATEIIDSGFLGTHPIDGSGAPRADSPGRFASTPQEGEYSEEDAAAVAAHLKDLGYIE